MFYFFNDENDFSQRNVENLDPWIKLLNCQIKNVLII